jgi:putative membrane protein
MRSPQKLKRRIALLRCRIDRNPTNSQLVLELGKALYESGLFDEAESAYRLAQEIAPLDDPWPCLYLGDLLCRRDEFPQALDVFDRARQIDPSIAITYACVGDAFACLGDDAMAYTYLRCGVVIQLSIDRILVSDTNDPRVFYAAERTMLAWVRTGLTVMGLGFVVARFGLFLRVIRHETDAQPNPGSTLIGVGLVLLGSAAVAVAAWQHAQFCRDLPADAKPEPNLAAWSVWFSLALSTVGVFLAGYILFGSNHS